jgi:hypothetical protein
MAGKKSYTKLSIEEEDIVNEHKLLSYDNTQLPPRSGLNLLLTIITSVWCSILFGYNTGVISAALLKIEAEIPMSSFEKSSLVSIILMGAIIGSAVTATVVGNSPSLSPPFLLPPFPHLTSHLPCSLILPSPLPLPSFSLKLCPNRYNWKKEDHFKQQLFFHCWASASHSYRQLLGFDHWQVTHWHWCGHF